MSLPSSIKLLWREIRLKPFSLSEAAAWGSSGQARYHEGDVRYLVSDDEAETVDTIIHEFLHHCDNQFHIIPEDIDKAIQERIVAQFASAVTTIMKDNPDLFPALQEMVNRGRTAE